MMFAVNNSPFAGQEGKFVTSRQIRDRLHRELNQDVALQVEDTDRPEVLKVSGRGLLHLGILIENMRREGFEFSVGKPRVIMREIDGKKHEPLETLVVDVPDVNAGKVIEVVGRRRGELTQMSSRIGLTNIEFTIPARGLIGLRTRLLTLTQGEATLSHVYLEYAPFKGDIPSRSTGVLISSEKGQTSAYSLFNLKDRGAFFVGATARVYKGMIVGEHSKDNDLEVNVCREKKLTNMRSSGADKKLFLAPPRLMSLEESLEFIEEDELVEVTPESIRLRKVDLLAKHRKRSTGAEV
jgi:GTP-binding protein